MESGAGSPPVQHKQEVPLTQNLLERLDIGVKGQKEPTGQTVIINSVQQQEMVTQ